MSETDDGAPPLGERVVLTKRPAWAFGHRAACETLAKHFGTNTLEGFGFDPEADVPALRAAGAILDYLSETQKTSLGHIDRLLPWRVGTTLDLKQTAARKSQSAS